METFEIGDTVMLKFYYNTNGFVTYKIDGGKEYFYNIANKKSTVINCVMPDLTRMILTEKTRQWN